MQRLEIYLELQQASPVPLAAPLTQRQRGIVLAIHSVNPLPPLPLMFGGVDQPYIIMVTLSTDHVLIVKPS
jgi:hypothetical protein